MSKKYKKNIPQKNANKPTRTAYEIKEQTAYFVKNRLPAFILAGFMIFWTIAGILGIVAYARGNTRKNAMVTASANAVNSYDITDFQIPLTGLYGLSTDTSETLAFEPTLHYYGSTVQLHYTDFQGSQYVDILDSWDTLVAQSLYDDNLCDIDIEVVSAFDFNYQVQPNFQYYYPTHIEYYSDENEPSLSLTVRVYFSYWYNNTEVFEQYHEVYLNVNWYVQPFYNVYQFPTQGFEYLLDRTGGEVYLFTQYLDFEDFALYRYERYHYKSLYDSSSVQIQGAYNEGFVNGKTQGYNNGYNAGFSDGVANANDYSFTGLLSAVFDVPVQTFTSLFNFDLLGVNLANFFLSLLTLAVVLAIIKLIV